MGIDLYYVPPSAPCASIRLLAKALGLDLNLKMVNLMEGEQMKPEFLKMNPQHTVPTMDDNGYILWESRAILAYLYQSYGKDDSLYPKCPKKRGVIDQRLYFDMGTLYQRFGDIVYTVAFGGPKEIPDEKRKKLTEALTLLDGFLEAGYVAGDSLSLADYAVIASMAAIEVVGVDLSSYKNILSWMKKCKETMEGFAEIDCSQSFGDFIVPKLKEAGVTL